MLFVEQIPGAATRLDGLTISMFHMQAAEARWSVARAAGGGEFGTVKAACGFTENELARAVRNGFPVTPLQV